MKRDLFIVLLSVAHVMVAASVQWNKIKSDGGDGLGGHYLRVDYRLESPQTILRSGSLSLGLESTPLNGKEFSVFCAVVNAWFAGAWAEAYYGDVVYRESFCGEGPYFMRSDEDDFSGYPITMTGNSDFYLMFACTEMGDNGHLRDDAVYGWVSFHIAEDGALSILESAYDADGGPMIVGGGSAIPEPSNALLLLAGCAALILKRRRG